MTKTYAQRITELDKNYKADAYCTDMKDIRKVEKALGLCDMETEMELRNMRDMVVLFYAFKMKSETVTQDMFNLQSITAVIDNQLHARGYAV